MTQLQAERNIERYLGAMRAGLELNETHAEQERDKRAKELLRDLETAEENLGEEERHEVHILHTAIGDLRLQYGLGKMEGAEKLSEIEHRLEHGYQKTKNALRKLRNLSQKEAQAVQEKIHRGWQALQTEVKLLYIRLDLAEEKTEEKISAAKDEIVKDIKSIANLARENAAGARDKAHGWTTQAKKSVSKRSHRILDWLDRWLLDED